MLTLALGPTRYAAKDQRTLDILATSVALFNVVDACLTLLWIETGIAIEANVLLRDLVETDPFGFVAIKLFVVSAGVWVLQRFATRRLAVAGLLLSFAAYAAVVGYHGFIAAFGW